MMKNKIYTYLGIVCLAVLTGCTTSSHSNENYTSSSDVVSVSLTHEQIHDGDQSKDTAYDSESSNDDYVRINDYTARYFSLLEECNVTEGYQTIGVHVAFVPEVGSFPIKQEIYQQVAYHALHIWDFYPEVNMFKYDILWDDKAKEPVMTITIDQSAIDNLESYYNSEKMFMEQGEEYAFDNCFTSVEETDETKSWRNTVVIDPNSPVP